MGEESGEVTRSGEVKGESAGDRNGEPGEGRISTTELVAPVMKVKMGE